MIKSDLIKIAVSVILLIIGSVHNINGQGAYRLNLEEVVALAQSDAPDALLASTRWKRNYWTYQTFLADFKPNILLNATTLPLFNRSIEPVVQPNGNVIYVPRAFMDNGVNISLQQDIALTGGSVYFGSGLDRLDLFATDGNEASRSYLSNPINFGFEQPLFQFNAMKWRKKIEPMVYKESEKIYSEQMEDVASQAADYFFNLLISQLDAEAAEQDKANADTLLMLSRGRYEVGKIAETDLLQVEINAMQAETRLAAAQLDMQTNAEQLRDFLDLQGDITFELVPPYILPDVLIDEEKALAYAMQNRSNIVSFDRRLMEANMEVERAKGESGVTARLNGSFGLTQTGPELQQVYSNLIDQEVVTFGISVPIADWGKSKARREVALSNLELEQRQVDQEKENFRRTVVLRAQQFDLVQRNAEIAERYLEAARKRYEISYQRYLIGKISVTDLNLALSDQESARRGYLQAVREYWMALYEIRGLTLYDFIGDKSLMLQTPVGG
ncbi:MAG: TolC family protein [Saprospiraceae bacterium]|nr:TolC family protein [Candidatus Opimibacter iunctus]